MTTQMSSWGGYPYYPQTSHRVNWCQDLAENLSSLGKKHGSVLPFGNGRSYGDSCLAASNHIICTRFLNRFIEADWRLGVVKAESGVTLEEVLDLAIPRGWFLPVTPGTKYVTLGGAVANDVHGKNHHVRGTFGCHVKSFSLLRSDFQSAIICSPEKNIELFKATVGGLGLTGIVEWVEFQLMPITSSFIDSKTIRFNSLAEFFDLSDELDRNHEYSVAWVDCSSRDKKLGRGVFIVGDHAESGGLSLNQKSKITVPLTPPFSLMNRVTVPLLNSLYYHSHSKKVETKTVSYDPFFYPLDSILKWNRVYGKKGFQQYQCVVPNDDAREAITEILQAISDVGAGSFLAVLKRCGDVKSPGLLSFPMPGISLALDFAESAGLNKKLFERLNSILRQAMGRIYPAKDAQMLAQDFQRFYGDWQKLESLRDPVINSHFWSRVTK